jgi:hypothetical protein
MYCILDSDHWIFRPQRSNRFLFNSYSYGYGMLQYLVDTMYFAHTTAEVVVTTTTTLLALLLERT